MTRCLLLLVLFCCGAVPCRAAAVPLFADYAGQYVMRLSSRNLLVIRLHLEGDHMSGSLERVRGFSGNALIKVTDPALATYSVQTATLISNHLRMIVRNAANNADVETWDLSLTDLSHASLSSGEMEDFAIEPYVLMRVAAQPLLAVSPNWDPNHVYRDDEDVPSSTAMAKIFEDDQKPRRKLEVAKEQWAQIEKGDEIRRKQVRELLRRGELHTGDDFEKAAFLFQHGSTAGDYLLAHTLAMIAVARGSQSALWIASATLDRYLQSTGKPQIYGTQYGQKPGSTWTQEPYDRSLVSDALRRSLGVPSASVQERQLQLYRSHSPK